MLVDKVGENSMTKSKSSEDRKKKEFQALFDMLCNLGVKLTVILLPCHFQNFLRYRKNHKN